MHRLHLRVDVNENAHTCYCAIFIASEASLIYSEKSTLTSLVYRLASLAINIATGIPYISLGSSLRLLLTHKGDALTSLLVIIQSTKSNLTSLVSI